MYKQTTPELARALERELDKCLRLAGDALGAELPRPDYTLDLRGKNAGMALLRDYCMRFNFAMLVEQPQEFIDQVVAHELAHLIAYRRFGARIRPHGAEWQWLMRDVFGRPPKVTHNFAARLHRRQLYVYSCKCHQPRELSAVRHHRAQAGTTYTCRICKQPLRQLHKQSGTVRSNLC